MEEKAHPVSSMTMVATQNGQLFLQTIYKNRMGVFILILYFESQSGLTTTVLGFGFELWERGFKNLYLFLWRGRVLLRCLPCMLSILPFRRQGLSLILKLTHLVADEL